MVGTRGAMAEVLTRPSLVADPPGLVGRLADVEFSAFADFSRFRAGFLPLAIPFFVANVR